MFAIARSYFASEESAEDAVQDAFLKAFQAIGQLEDGSRFAGWVAKITMTTCIRALQARARPLSLADFASSASVTLRVGQRSLTPATLVSKAEHAELVKAALGRLPENQRVVLLLRYAENLSYDQIASYTECSLSTVRGRLYCARHALRHILKELETTGG
jgi:RNA polymerase sigma-70 factor (ECF subfamily)